MNFEDIDILAVEDNAINLALLHAILEARGFRLHDASSLQQARQLLAQRSFDLVLLDLRMPDGHGLDLAREIRHRPDTSRLPIIVVSASVLPTDQASCIEAGCNMFLTKPVMPKGMLSAVEAVIRSRVEARTTAC